MAKDRYGNERTEVKNSPQHAMPGDVIAGPKDELIFRPVVIAGTNDQAATSLAKHAAQAMREGYEYMQYIPSSHGEGVMVFKLINKQ